MNLAPSSPSTQFKVDVLRDVFAEPWIPESHSNPICKVLNLYFLKATHFVDFFFYLAVVAGCVF